MNDFFAFTTSYNGRTNRLINEAVIVYGQEQMHTKNAQWDTGATNTCISKTVSDRLGLVPVSNTLMQTPSGQRVANVFVVDIVLRNNVTVKDIQVIESDIGQQGIDVLIGMDIITLGDLAVSNVNGQTKFSFRVPSCEEIDFVKQIKDTIPDNDI